MPSALDQYTNIQKRIADKKAAGQSLVTNKENIDKAVTQFGQENVNQALGQVQAGGVGIQNTTTGANIAPPPEPTPGSSLVTPPKTNVSPTQAPIVPPEPTKAPEPIKTETAVQTSTPITPPVGFQYGNQMDAKTGMPTLVKTSEFERQKKLETNKTLYANGKSIFDGVKSGSLIPGSQDFADLQTVNPNAFAEYQALKQNDDRKNAVEVLGSTIIGEAPPTRKNATLDSLIANITGGMDGDIATNYKNAVTNNPEYIQATNKVNALNTQLADVNNNLRQLGEDVRKKYSADTPESLIASAIARDAKPLIDQAQYIQDQVTNAQAEATRIFENNKEVFGLQMQERTDNRNLAFKLYDTINADEIRQEDIQREDERIKKEIALEEYRYQRELADGNMIRAEERKNKLDDLRVQDEYNMKNGLLQLGVDPTGMTPEEMNKQYAYAAQLAASQKESKIISGIKPGELIYQDGKFITAPGAGGTGNVTPNRPNIRYETTANNGGVTVNVQAGYAGPEDRRTKYAGGYQCGQFVNDVAGIGVGDTLSEKEGMITKDLKATPGAAFVEDIGNIGAINGKPTGHIGIIEKVYDDGSIEVVEANYAEPGKVTRTTISPSDKRYKNIKGFIETDLMKGPETKYLDITDITLPEKTTEFKAKSFGYGSRMDSSDKILQDADKRFTESYSIDEYLTPRGEYTPNWLKSADQQKYEQAQRDFINAKLRQESGAVISPQEFENARLQYFAQPGDAAETIAQKKKNRELVISEMFRHAGKTENGEDISGIYSSIKKSRLNTTPPPIVSSSDKNEALKIK